MFEQATRMKLRFVTSKGALTVEQLWDLPLTTTNGAPSLDSLAMELDAEIKQTSGASFVRAAPTDLVPAIKLDILVHIIKVRMQEKEAASVSAANKAEKQKILSIIAKKQDSAMESKSIEELAAIAASL